MVSERDLEYLVVKLLLGYKLYFDRDGVLNSEGRKLFEEIARLLVYEHPEFKPLVKKTRKNPTLSNVVKVAETLVDPERVRELVEAGVQGPYKYAENPR